MRQLRFAAFLLVTALLTCGCGARLGKAPLAEVDRYPRLETVEPTRTVMQVKVELLATVEPFEKADLIARVAGEVTELPPDIDIGRRIKAGEVLFKLAVPELEADKNNKEALLEQARKQKLQVKAAQQVAAKELEEAKEQENRYKAEHAYRKDLHQRMTQLVERSVQQPERAQETRSQLEAAEAAWRVAKVQIETKQAKVEALAIDLEVAETRIRVAQTELERARVLLDYAVIRAPFNGVITKRWADRGATHTLRGTHAGMLLLTVMNNDTVRVLLDFAERDVPLVNATEQNPNPDGNGDPVVLRFPSLRDTVPNGEFQGTITRLAGALDSTTRTMRAEVHLDNRKGLLRPGMYGTATVILEERSNCLVIPSTALSRRGSDVEVYYVEELEGNPPRGAVRVAKVTLGLDDGQRVEIRGGLPNGKARVIARSSSVVREGDTIIPVPLRDWEP
jgi:RND family efflux transporter MFP subunit